MWSSTKDTDIHAQELTDSQPAFRDLSALLTIDEAADATAAKDHDRKERERRERKEREQQKEQARAARAAQATSSSSSPMTTSDSDEDTAHVAGWQGKEVTFMRSNQHSKERSGKWDTSGLPPAPHPLHELVVGDEKAPNWLGKLGVAKHVLVDQSARYAGMCFCSFLLSWTLTYNCICCHNNPRPSALSSFFLMESCACCALQGAPVSRSPRSHLCVLAVDNHRSNLMCRRWWTLQAKPPCKIGTKDVHVGLCRTCSLSTTLCCPSPVPCTSVVLFQHSCCVTENAHFGCTGRSSG